MMAEQIAREVNETGWRRTTYQRPDGSTFHVALPPNVDEHYNRHFDETAEQAMVQTLNGDGDDPSGATLAARRRCHGSDSTCADAHGPGLLS